MILLFNSNSPLNEMEKIKHRKVLLDFLAFILNRFSSLYAYCLIMDLEKYLTDAKLKEISSHLSCCIVLRECNAVKTIKRPDIYREDGHTHDSNGDIIDHDFR